MKLQAIELNKSAIDILIAQCDKKSWIVVYKEENVLKYKELPAIPDDQVYVKVAEKHYERLNPMIVFRNNLNDLEQGIVLKYLKQYDAIDVKASVLLIIEIK
jgi:hypothetical protein